MGKTVQANAVITLNMEPARQKVEEFEGLIGKAKKELEELNKKPINLQTDKEKKRIKELTDKEIPKLEQQLKKAKDSLKGFRDTLQHLDKASINDLTNAKRALNDQIRRLTPGTKEYIAATSDFKKVNDRLASLNAAYRQVNTTQGGLIGGIKGVFGWFNKYWGGLTMLSGALTGLSTTFRKCAEDAAKLDDVYADVMKTTGLMHDEVAALDEELKKIDTRTSREQLLLLARDAGKLGIQGKENILGFVRAADQIQVALGEDLGEGAIKNLGKIADVFGLTKEMGIEKSLLSIASAVNALGQASTASEAYLVDFTQRLAGVGAMAGLSVQDILGFASGLDQSAMKVEMAATAFQKFLMKMYEDTATFAGYANMEVEEFSKLLKTNANEAITTVMKAMNGQDGFASLVPMFDQMGLDGARAVTVLASMTKNLDAVTEAQALANAEFAKGTSVTEEYNTKNNNLQARLEKARKEFHNASIALGQSLNPIMLKSTKFVTYLIKALASYGKEIKSAIITIAALTAIIKLNTIAHAAYNAVVKIGATLQATWKTVIWATRTAFLRLIGATEAATIAQAELNAVMSASVIGVIALAVGGLTAAITHLVRKQREATETTDYLTEAEKKANEQYGEEVGKINALTSIVKNNNIALGERKKALEELKRIVPGYHGDLTEEGRLINSNKEAIDEYCKSLRNKIQLEARKEQLLEIERQIAALEDQKEDAQDRMYEALKKSGGNTAKTEKVTAEKYNRTTGDYYTAVIGEKLTPYGKASEEAEEIQKQIEKLEKQAEKVGDKIGKSFTDPIEKIKAEYEKMFTQIRKESIDDPKAGNAEIERLRAERDQKIAELHKTFDATSEVLAEGNEILTKAQFEYLQERQDKLTKKEKEMVQSGYVALTEEQSKLLKARYDKLMAADSNAADKLYQAQVKRLEQNQRAEQNLINQQFFDKAITAKEHEKQLRDITMKYLQEKLKLAEENGKDTTTIEAAIYNEQVKNRKADYDTALKQLQASQKAEENALALSLATQEITEKEYQSKMLEVKMRYLQEKLQLAHDAGQDETDILQAILDAQLEATKAANDEMAKLKEEARKVMEDLMSPSEARNAEMQEQLNRLDVLHKAMLLSEQQYEEAVRQLRKKYADEDLQDKLANLRKYTDTVNSLMSESSSFISSLKTAETAQLEAEYQKQLTAAGNNAQKRQEIEAEFERKKLEIEKQYADVEMAIKISKTIASGAVAAIRAYEEGGPFAGVALAALIAGTTAAEVATIIAQRNAIKNSSVGGTGGSGSSDTSTVSGNNGNALDGYRVPTGYGGGGFTDKDASDQKAVGVVHANEWVAPAWLVRRKPRMFAKLELERRRGMAGGSDMGNRVRGFAEGGHTGGADNGLGNLPEIDWQAMREFNDMMRYCSEHGLFVKYGDIVDAKRKNDRFKSQTSRT